MMNGKHCARCEKTVYPTEELKCLDKVWHKTCFKCHQCGMILNMKTYKGFNKLPYCNAHYPQARATTVAETPESRRLAENTKIQSNIKYHEDFEKQKGKLTPVADDPETLRIRNQSKIISNATYHGEYEKKKQMEERRNMLAENETTYNNNNVRPGGGSSVMYQQQQPVSPAGQRSPMMAPVINNNNSIINNNNLNLNNNRPINVKPVQAMNTTTTTNVPKKSPIMQQQQQQQLQQQQSRPTMMAGYPSQAAPVTGYMHSNNNNIKLQQTGYNVAMSTGYPVVPPGGNHQMNMATGTGYPGAKYHHQQPPPSSDMQMYHHGGSNPGVRIQAVPPLQQQQQQQYRNVVMGLCYRAIYDYTAQDLDEISFIDGDLLVNCRPIDDGWMTGTVQRTGQNGMFPSNYVENA